MICACGYDTEGISKIQQISDKSSPYGGKLGHRQMPPKFSMRMPGIIPINIGRLSCCFARLRWYLDRKMVQTPDTHISNSQTLSNKFSQEGAYNCRKNFQIFLALRNDSAVGADVQLPIKLTLSIIPKKYLL